MFEKVPDIKSGSLTGKVALITGANCGIGREATKALVRAGCECFMACRSSDRAIAAIKRIADELQAEGITVKDAQMTFIKLDLIDLGSVRDCAKQFQSTGKPLHILINNAGLAGTGKKTSKEGLEESFAVCHVGHFLLTSLLLDILKQSSAAGNMSRIVNVSSIAHAECSEIDYEQLKGAGGSGSMQVFKAYQVSKFANVLFTQELARRLRQHNIPLLTFTLHPGIVSTEIWKNLGWFKYLLAIIMISEKVGSYTTLYCATSPQLENVDHSGKYYDNCQEKAASKNCTPEKARVLWQKSLEWCQIPEFLPILEPSD